MGTPSLAANTGFYVLTENVDTFTLTANEAASSYAVTMEPQTVTLSDAANTTFVTLTYQDVPLRQVTNLVADGSSFTVTAGSNTFMFTANEAVASYGLTYQTVTSQIQGAWGTTFYTTMFSFADFSGLLQTFAQVIFRPLASTFYSPFYTSPNVNPALVTRPVRNLTQGSGTVGGYESPLL